MAKKIQNLFTEEVGSKIKVSSFSKTKLGQFGVCPRKAWYLERELAPEETPQLLLGTTAHAYMAQRIASEARIPYEPVIPAGATADILEEAKRMVKYYPLKSLLEGNRILEVEKRVSHILPGQLRLVGIFDAVAYVEDPVLGPYIRVLEFKTSFKISQEIDEEAMIYAWLAAKEYGMNVLFTRFSGRGREKWEQFFRLPEALGFGESLRQRILVIKETLEQEETPFPKAGPHCATCPFLERCVADDEVDNLDALSPEEIFSLLTREEEKVRQLKHRMKAIVEEGEWEGGEHYQPVVKESVSYRARIAEDRDRRNPIRGKAVKKADLLAMVAEAGLLDEFLSDLDIKLSESAREKLSALGFEFTESIRRSVSVEPVEEIEGENNEQES